MAGLLAAVLALALLVTGIVLVVNRPGAPAGAPQGTAPASPVGDPATADPCSLLNQAALARFGSTRLILDYLYPESCGVQLTSSGPGQVVVSARFDAGDTTPPPGAPEPAGQFSVYRPAPGGTACNRVVGFPGSDVYVYLQATAFDGAKADLCAIAEETTGSTVARLAGPGVGRRPAETNPAALTSLNVCAVADATIVGRVSGLDTSRREDGFGHWSCYWGGDPAFDYSPRVSIHVVRPYRLGGTATRIGAHSAAVLPDYYSSSLPRSCTVTLVQRRFVNVAGENRVDGLEVTVYAGDQPNPALACSDAKAIAGAVERRLPAPS